MKHQITQASKVSEGKDMLSFRNCGDFLYYCKCIYKCNLIKQHLNKMTMMVLYRPPEDPDPEKSNEQKTQLPNIFRSSEIVTNKDSVSLFKKKVF